MDAEYFYARVRELEDLLVRAQGDLFAREEAARVARGNVSYFVGAVEEARRGAAAARGEVKEG